MSEPMTVPELDQAARALQAWFESQGIAPPDAGIICMQTVARLLVMKTRDVSELQTNIELHRSFLMLETAGLLRGLWR